jgi:hypothetical protein
MALPSSTNICFTLASFLIFLHLIKPFLLYLRVSGAQAVCGYCERACHVPHACCTRAVRKLTSSRLDGGLLLREGSDGGALSQVGLQVHDSRGENSDLGGRGLWWPNSPEPTNVPILQIFIFQCMEVAPFWAGMEGKTWKRFWVASFPIFSA